MENKFNQVIFAVCIFIVLGIIIIPLPAYLIDFFIAINIATSIVLLGTSLYLNKPVELAVLPTVILAATLFRLALNISSTRAILAYGQAGKVVDTFGQIVAGGNLVVGIILFVVLTIVQLMVISKGAERIAEVSARFTLDAMPGKQMAIDGELNLGMIDGREAKRRRDELSLESNFFGSMDGATKFVKGDSMAGIILVIINMLGGMGIGILQKGMDPAMAANKYVVLTIGDALGSQIPALITSISTGLIATRSTSSGESISSETIAQFIKNPMALIIAGGLFGMMSFIPGMPFYFFFPIAGLIVFAGWMAMQKERLSQIAMMQQQESIEEQSQEPPPSTPEEMYNLLGVDSLAIHVGRNLIQIADPASGGRLIEEVGHLRQSMTLQYGYILPSVRVADSPYAGPYDYHILVRGNKVAQAILYPQYYMIIKSHWDRDFSEPPAKSLEGIEPVLGQATYWVQPEIIENLVQQGKWNKPYATAVQALTYHLSEIVIQHMDELLTKVEVKTIIEKVREVDPTLVENLIPSLLNVSEIRRILVNLLKEKVSIKDIHYILERLEDFASTARDVDLLSEKTRICLARQICAQNAFGQVVLGIIISPDLEEYFEKSLQKIDEKFILALDHKITRDIWKQIQELVQEIYTNYERKPVIVCNPGVRLPLARVIESFDKQQKVLSYSEINPDFKFEHLGTIYLPEAQAVKEQRVA